MSIPNVNKRSAYSNLVRDSASVESFPCKHGEIYNCGTIYNVYCGFCDTINSVSGKNAAAASSFICPKCRESIPNDSGNLIHVDGFNLIRHYNKHTYSFDCENEYYIIKPKLHRQEGYSSATGARDIINNNRILDHNEHLVGVELNPGPLANGEAYGKILIKQEKKKKKNKQKKNKSSKSAGIPGSSMGPLTKAYINAMVNPLENPPMRAGFMTYSPTMLYQPFIRINFTLANDGLMIIVNPDACLSSSNSTASSFLSNFLTTIQYTNTTANTVSAWIASNRSAIVTGTNTNKLNACGVKVVIAHAQTSTPGLISLYRYNGVVALTSLDAYTPQSILSTAGSSTYTTEGGTATVRCNWLPSDATDFEFARNDVYNNGEGVINPFVVALTGFPAGTRVFIDLVAHIECQTGVTNAGAAIPDEKAGNSDPSNTTGQLIDEHPGSDSFMRRSRDAVSSASQAVQFTAEKVSQVEDIISKSYQLYHGAEKIFSSAANSRLGKALSKSVTTSSKFLPYFL